MSDALIRYDDPDNKETGRLWVEYSGGRQAPLEPRLGAGFIGTLGYTTSILPHATSGSRDDACAPSPIVFAFRASAIQPLNVPKRP